MDDNPLNISAPKDVFEKAEMGKPADTITVRDYFAGKAMEGNLSRFIIQDIGLEQAKNIAKNAYFMADLMLAEREKQSQKLGTLS